MPPSVLTAAAAIGLAIALLTWSVLTRPGREAAQVKVNLQRRLVGRSDGASQSPVGEQPPQLLEQVARRLTPPGTADRLNRMLVRAGRPAAWPLGKLLVAKPLLALVAGLLGLLYLSSTTSTLALLLVVAVTIVAYFVPELLLHSRAQERSQKIGLELADTLDQMTIAVEAGLGFDAAMARAGKNGKGPLAQELVRTLQDIQVGHSRRQAYESLAKRTDVVDLRRFIRAVIQADAYGIAIADVLRTQAAEMRMKRRQRAEEKAMQIPVKVIFPLMLCILPVLFIVLLGPAALDIIAAFS